MHTQSDLALHMPTATVMEPGDLCPQPSSVEKQPGHCLVYTLPQCIKSNKIFQFMPSLYNVRWNACVGIACLQLVAHVSGSYVATNLFDDHFQFGICTTVAVVQFLHTIEN